MDITRKLNKLEIINTNDINLNNAPLKIHGILSVASNLSISDSITTTYLTLNNGLSIGNSLNLSQDITMTNLTTTTLKASQLDINELDVSDVSTSEVIDDISVLEYSTFHLAPRSLSGLLLSNTSDNITGALRWTGSHFEGYVDNSWNKIDSESSHSFGEYLILDGIQHQVTGDMSFIGQLDLQTITINNNIILDNSSNIFCNKLICNNIKLNESNANEITGVIRYNSNKFEGFNGNSWNRLDGLDNISSNDQNIIITGNTILTDISTFENTIDIQTVYSGSNLLIDGNTNMYFNKLQTQYIRIGDTPNETEGNIRFNSNKFEGYNGNEWLQLDLEEPSGILVIRPDDATFNSTITSIGQNSLSVIQSITNNTAIGRNTLMSSLTGNSNIGIGINTLKNTVTNSNNIGIGNYTLETMTQGGGNISFGHNSLKNTSDAISNITLGHNLLNSNDSPTNNIYIGNKLQTIAQTSTPQYNINIETLNNNDQLSGNNNIRLATNNNGILNTLESFAITGNSDTILSSDSDKNVYIPLSGKVNGQTLPGITIDTITTTLDTFGQGLSMDMLTCSSAAKLGYVISDTSSILLNQFIHYLYVNLSVSVAGDYTIYFEHGSHTSTYTLSLTTTPTWYLLEISDLGLQLQKNEEFVIYPLYPLFSEIFVGGKKTSASLNTGLQTYYHGNTSVSNDAMYYLIGSRYKYTKYKITDKCNEYYLRTPLYWPISEESKLLIATFESQTNVSYMIDAEIAINVPSKSKSLYSAFNTTVFNYNNNIISPQAGLSKITNIRQNTNGITFNDLNYETSTNIYEPFNVSSDTRINIVANANLGELPVSFAYIHGKFTITNI